MGNREALLEAAITCLRERGFGRTRARDLAAAAEVSLGAIRYHFGSTEALLNEAIAESSRRWLRDFQKTLCPSGSHPDTSMAAVGNLFGEFAANRALIAGFVEAFAHAQRSTAARTQLAGYYDELRRAIARTMGGDNTADTVASLLIALVDGLMVQWLLAPDRCPDPDSIQRAMSALVASNPPTNTSPSV